MCVSIWHDRRLGDLRMPLRTSLGFWSATFFASLGLTPLVACGGTTTGGTKGGDPGSDSGVGGGAGGSPAAGGSRHTGPIGYGGTTMGYGGTPWGYGGTTPGAGGIVWGYGGTTPGAGGIVWGYGGTLGDGGYIATAGGASPYYPPCVSPALEVGVDGRPTGFVSCSGGALHREVAAACPSLLPRAQACSTGTEDAGAGFCGLDTDCTEHPNGECYFPGPGAHCTCTYGCTKDADCGEGSICLCDNIAGHCVPATCSKDADCAPGALCLSYAPNAPAPGWCAGHAFTCQTSLDGCISNADCGSGACILTNGARQCGSIACGIGGVTGRPFLVLGEERVASIDARADWASGLSPHVRDLSKPDRARLGARWTEIGLMEHASIAAFARLALELLSLGAPPSLVEQASRAMADETRHARDAFALASAYLGRHVGPGALDVAESLAGRSPLEIVRTTVLEGCIGETIAAVEAAEALAHATDPAAREALARVTEDETRHAELAWRLVQWVLEEGPADLATSAARELVTLVDAAAESRGATGSRADVAPVLRAHGFVSEAVRSEIGRRVLAEVIAPCARALVASFSRARQASSTAASSAA